MSSSSVLSWPSVNGRRGYNAASRAYVQWISVGHSFMFEKFKGISTRLYIFLILMQNIQCIYDFINLLHAANSNTHIHIQPHHLYSHIGYLEKHTLQT